MSRYQSISLEKSLIAKIDETLKKNPFYSSRAEFVRRAIQIRVEELEKK
jgi:metal-responsive CopG/Arc/MetJ family transcriptional regulator